jgi:uncharacterized phage protein (TIGR02218 family)
MTFAAREDSRYDAQPGELYLFTLGTREWAFTSGDEPVEFLGRRFIPTTIARGALFASQDAPRQSLDITVSQFNSVAQEFLPSGPPDQEMAVQLFRTHFGDAEVALLWSGTVASVRIGGANATLSCDPEQLALERNLLKRRFSGTCTNVLFDENCTLNRNAFAVNAVLSEVVGVTLTSSDFATKPNDWLAGGYIESGNSPRRMILSHVGAVITIRAPIDGLAGGQSVRAFAGCGHTLQICRDKFNNELNYWGFEFIGNNLFSKGVA